MSMYTSLVCPVHLRHSKGYCKGHWSSSQPECCCHGFPQLIDWFIFFAITSSYPECFRIIVVHSFYFERHLLFFLSCCDVMICWVSMCVLSMLWRQLLNRRTLRSKRHQRLPLEKGRVYGCGVKLPVSRHLRKYINRRSVFTCSSAEVRRAS